MQLKLPGVVGRKAPIKVNTVLENYDKPSSVTFVSATKG